MIGRMTARFTTGELHGQAIRYVVAGVTNTGIYVGLTLLLSGPLGVPIQVAIPIAFVTALCTHFTLQRFFVFRSRTAFKLSAGHQAGRYVAVGSVQYAITAAATALLPGWLGVSERAVYVVTVAVISATTFLLLRSRVFHAHD